MFPRLRLGSTRSDTYTSKQCCRCLFRFSGPVTRTGVSLSSFGRVITFGSTGPMSSACAVVTSIKELLPAPRLTLLSAMLCKSIAPSGLVPNWEGHFI